MGTYPLPLLPVRTVVVVVAVLPEVTASNYYGLIVIKYACHTQFHIMY